MALHSPFEVTRLTEVKLLIHFTREFFNAAEWLLLSHCGFCTPSFGPESESFLLSGPFLRLSRHGHM